MAAYAEKVDSLDQSVGRVIEALRRSGADRNMRILFLSNSGAFDQECAAPLDKPGQTWRADGTPTKVGSEPGIQPGRADKCVIGVPPWALPIRHSFTIERRCRLRDGARCRC